MEILIPTSLNCSNQYHQILLKQATIYFLIKLMKMTEPHKSVFFKHRFLTNLIKMNNLAKMEILIKLMKMVEPSSGVFTPQLLENL